MINPFVVLHLVHVCPKQAVVGDEFRVGDVEFTYLGWEKSKDDGYVLLLDSGVPGQPWRALSTPAFPNTDDLFHVWFTDVALDVIKERRA